MANKITPGSDKAAPSSSSAQKLDIMKAHVKSKMCYNSSALTNAKVINDTQDRFAYQIDIWTLMECRKMKKMTQPYKDEKIPSETNRNEWDFDLDRPPTVLKKAKNDVRPLDETRWTTVCKKCSGFSRCHCKSCNGDGGKPCHYCKVRALTEDEVSDKKACSHCKNTNTIHCATCKSTGMVDCTDCKGCGKTLHWYQLAVKWYTIHSVSYQTNTSIPPKIIHQAPGKKEIWSTDQKWSKTESFDKYFQNSFVKQHANSHLKLDQLTEDFNKKHLKYAKKNCRIVQIKCTIQKLDVFEVEYEAEGFTNKEDKKMGNKFKFYHYGKDKKEQPIVYENDYPLNTCGCCGNACAHHSKLCTIS